MWRTAIIGYGASAEYFHRVCMARSGKFDPVVAFDSAVGRRDAALAHGFREALDLDSLPKALVANNIAVVVVASPNAAHRSGIAASIEVGASIIVDKPAVVDGEDFAALTRESRERGCWLLPFHNRAHDNDHRLVLDALTRREIGELLRVDVAISQPRPWNTFATPSFDPTWRLQRRWGGGVLNDWGPHVFDQLHRVLGGPLRVVGGRAAGANSDRVESMITVTLLRADIEARVVISACEPDAAERWRLVGTDGTIVVRGSDGEGEVVVHRPEGTRQARYFNGPELGVSIYEALDAALSGRDTATANRMIDDGIAVYDLLGRVRSSLGPP